MRGMVLTLLLLAGAGGARAQNVAEFQALEDRLGAAGNRGDAAAIAAMYAEDAVLIGQDGRRYQGRLQIQAYWQATAQALKDGRITTRVVLPLTADLVEEDGVYAAVTRATPNQPAGGSYTVVWRKVGSDWRLMTNIVR